MKARPARRAGAWLALCALIALGVGCGGGDASTDGASPDHDARVTRAEARAYAHAVNLRPSDFPYLEHEQPDREDSTTSRETTEKLNRCFGGGVSAKPVAEARSDTFNGLVGGDFQQFESTIEVMPSANLTERLNAAYRSPRAFHCLARVLPPALKKEEQGEVAFDAADVSRLASPAPEIKTSFGYRISAAVTVTPGSTQFASYSSADPLGEQVTVPAHIDLFGFTSGQAEVTLLATGIPLPVPTALERHLLQLLHVRARENDLGSSSRAGAGPG